MRIGAVRLLPILFVFMFGCLTCTTSLLAGCTDDRFFGATSEDPVMSSVDITFSPVYSSATTSGTSGCKNWNIGRLLKEERMHFVRVHQLRLLFQSAKGYGPELEVLSRLMSCEPEVQPVFNRMLHRRFRKTEELLGRKNGFRDYPDRVASWIKRHRILQKACPFADLSEHVHLSDA